MSLFFYEVLALLLFPGENGGRRMREVGWRGKWDGDGRDVARFIQEEKRTLSES